MSRLHQLVTQVTFWLCGQLAQAGFLLPRRGSSVNSDLRQSTSPAFQGEGPPQP